MSHRQELLKKINTYSNTLIKKSQWYSHPKKPFGHIDYKKENKKNYIYEFFCYLKILKDLQKNYEVKYIPGPEQFPMSPASKRNKSKFLLKDPQTKIDLYQVCSGVEINISHIINYSIAPDISFQKPAASDTPDESDVLLIMDAKYKSNPRKNKLSVSQLRDFADCVNDFRLINLPSIVFHNTNFLLNCILTNGIGDQNKQHFCIRKKMRLVEKFDTSGTLSYIG